jgi:hypothetical protein
VSFTEHLRLIVDLDAGGAVRNVETYQRSVERAGKETEKTLDKVGVGLQKAGAGMVTFGAVAFTGLLKAGDAASDLNEVASKSATVFGDANEQVVDFADNAAKIGLSKKAALEAASGFGNMFDQLDIASNKAADMSIQVTELAADFASFHNADITTVLEAQSAAFRGEYDSIQQFLPLLSAATVEQKAMALTGKENKDALTAQDKALATYELMLEGAGQAQGDFARTSDSAANQQRILAAEFENLKASLGQGVLPVMKTGLAVANKFVSGMAELNAVTDGTAGKIATIGAVGFIAVGGLSALIGKLITVRENFATAKDGIGAFTEKLGGAGKAGAYAGIAAGVATVAFALKEVGDARHEAELDRLAEDFLRIGDTIDETTTEAVRKLNEFGSLDAVFRRLLEESPVAAEGLLKIAEAADVSQDKIAELREEVEAKRDTDATAAVNQEKYAEETRNAADAMETAAPAAKSLEEQLEDQAEAAKAAEEELKALNDALDGILSHYLSVPQAISAQNQKLLETTQHFKDMNEEYGRNALSLDISTEAGIKNTEMLDGLFESAGGVIEAMRNTGRAEQDVQVQWASSRGELQLVIDKFRAAGIDVSKYDELLGAIDRHVTTNVRVQGVAAAMGQLGELRRQYSGHEYLVRVKAAVDRGGLNIGGGSFRVFHDGGIVPGPRGQEVAAILQAGEQVLSLDDPRNEANAGRQFMGGGGMGGGPALYLTVNVDARGSLHNPAELERVVGRAVDGAVRKGYITALAAAR